MWEPSHGPECRWLPPPPPPPPVSGDAPEELAALLPALELELESELELELLELEELSSLLELEDAISSSAHPVGQSTLPVPAIVNEMHTPRDPESAAGSEAARSPSSQTVSTRALPSTESSRRRLERRARDGDAEGIGEGMGIHG